MAVGEVSTVERFFRRAGSLDIDKSDVRRYQDFIHQKIYDLLLMAEGTARANERDIIQPRDLPITKGLQESIHRFRRLDVASGMESGILEELAAWPPLETALDEETQAGLPEIAGGLSYALAQAFKILDPEVANPQTRHWKRAFEIFNLLL